MFKVDNAIILAAGTASRFAPLSFERHKGLTEVRGEVLIERQIRQLNEAGVKDIYIVTGYKAGQFDYLKEKFGVQLIHNPDYLKRNNNSSIWAARKVIRNSYICSSDNYFAENPFEAEVECSYYSAVYAKGETAEWCIEEDVGGYIKSVKVGGHDSWYMLGHVFWDSDFSARFLFILNDEYDRPETTGKLWESIFIDHINELPMKMRKYQDGVIYEFDTLDELRGFDTSYVSDTRSAILKSIAKDLGITEVQISQLKAFKDKNEAAAGFTFMVDQIGYKYSYENQKLEEIRNG